MNLKSVIREIPDFPEKGIGFKDITTLVKNKDAFKYAVDLMVEDLKDKEIQFKDMPEKQKNKTLQEMNLLLQDLRHIGNSVGFDKDVPELDNITKRDVKSMNKIAYIRQAVEKAIKPKEKAPKRKILCRTKQSNKEKSQSLGTGQERMLLLQNES